ncbi:MBL fold metallo-hydrolase [Roseivirga sp.]|uniref:MBL fold metallo-hydrolase n=1 Tax=Roseivirga sp. TaxID=1964215 RepID=UPI003B52B648
MQIKTFTFNPFMENTYVVYDQGKAAIIDPGCYDPAEEKELVEFVQKEGLEVEKILSTHGHIDHVLGNAFVKNHFNIPLWIGEHDQETLRSVAAYAPSYGFQKYTAVEPDVLMKEGEYITIGSSQLKVLFVPGHAPGHIAFYHETEGFVLGGDVLFRESIGRTDLPGGDFDTLINSIRTEFFTLPNDTVVYPGHGGETTIGYEKKYNPFCKVA